MGPLTPPVWIRWESDQERCQSAYFVSSQPRLTAYPTLPYFSTYRRKWQPTPVFLPGESPWTEVSGGLQSMGSQRVGHDCVTKHHSTYPPAKGKKKKEARRPSKKVSLRKKEGTMQKGKILWMAFWYSTHSPKNQIREPILIWQHAPKHFRQHGQKHF